VAAHVAGDTKEGEVMSTLRKPHSRASLAFPLALLAMLLVTVLALAACGGSGTAGTSPSASPLSAPSAAVSPSAPGRVVHALHVDRDVRYTSWPQGGKGSSLLDVYAPVDAGPWPVVVLLHGGGANKNDYEPWARKAAKRGAVVYVPTWSLMDNEKGAKLSAEELRAALTAAIGNIGAAVRFARGTAASYGGDPEDVTLFGHSYGAMGATMEAFSGVPASANGLQGAGSPVPESLVAFDPDYVLAVFGDDLMARDPGLMHVFSPWDYLGKKVDFPITIIDSRTPGMYRPSRHPWAKSSWWQTRDTSGDLRRALEDRGAFNGGRYNSSEGLRLFAERLRADGDTLTYIALTDSSHWELGKRGMASMLDALVPSSQRPVAASGGETTSAASPVAASPSPTVSASAGGAREGLVWKFETGAAVESAPAVSRGVVYFGNDDGQLYAMGIRSGRQRWAFTTGGKILSALAVAEGAVYCRSDDGYLYAVDIQSGRERWRFKADGAAYSSPAVGGGMVYVAVEPGTVCALDGGSGRVIWKVTVESEPQNAITSPGVSGGVVYYSAGGNLYALDGTTGQHLWTSDQRVRGVLGTPAVDHGLVYVREGDNWPFTKVSAVDAESGKRQWVSRMFSQDTTARYTSPAVGGGVVYVTRGDGMVFALDGHSGREKWSSRKGLVGEATPTVGGGVVCLSNDHGWLHALDADTGRKAWEFKTGAGVLTSPVISKGVVCIGSDDGSVYVVK
jgi:outer membrane protein assembly factor BamB